MFLDYNTEIISIYSFFVSQKKFPLQWRYVTDDTEL